ncbi:cobyric acid synthase [Acetobacter conturbans]|uniref:Cobyric acid synthase n=1 Tax=Acetobacter conturbans TaxID=1737472 RepID=A0ABX0K1V5_9PROT|nr:cobyric acid synthase [Acetobacter conturbans]NHN89621.1 cobyric acid synthase [Acetobacter conturbans]
MIQGTGSSVGKSVLVAGLARAFTNRGLRVRPFKPQNMSNNAAVVDGGEIGRAQALQAQACRVPATVDMNPVLLKPQSEIGAQLVLRGMVQENVSARGYQFRKASLMPAVLESFGQLRRDTDLVLVEGAGSASEVNLREHDIANMGFAEAADIDVVLAGDIDRGGVIAALVGTKTVLDEKDSARIKGFLVNRMRGDLSLFADGMRAIAHHTGWAPLGLIPHSDIPRSFPAEDAADLRDLTRSSGAEGFRIAVPWLPLLSNFDDLDPLKDMAGVSLIFVPPGQPLPVCDLVILPGSKSTRSDLTALRREGWDIDILAHHRRGGAVLGLCGGYQMLGRQILDPSGIEGPAGNSDGLGLLDVVTVLEHEKILRPASGFLTTNNMPVHGYEMHMGQTDGADRERPFVVLDQERPEGAISQDGRVFGTYLHGILDNARARASILTLCGMERAAHSIGMDQTVRVDNALDAWATHLAQHVDLDALLALAR